mmetsp:Transcript_14864/g.20999  ORF Transcript_14864/g.20999 Transcript_14864/m.20999 type:complete len:1620 (-) Transcript_14864:2986-7845(-)
MDAPAGSGPSDPNVTVGTRDATNMDDDELANMMTQVMEQNRFGPEMTHALAQRANLVNSVQWLSQHVPVCVLDRLASEVNAIEGDADSIELASSSPDEGHLSDLSDDEEEKIPEDDVNNDDPNLFRDNAGPTLLNQIAEEEEEESDNEDSEGDQAESPPEKLTEAALERKNAVESASGHGSTHTPTENGSNPLVKKLDNSLRLPYASRHHCAMLFVDISGFTKLSKLVTPERLSETINAYFQMIVDEVTAHGGDILKFAGDALFAEWKARTEDDDLDGPDSIPRSVELTARPSLADATVVAATCGASIVSKCSDYAVFSTATGAGGINLGEHVATLNVHCGLGVGEVVGIHVGDHESRREYLIVGDPIKQSTDAADLATHGEFLVSPESLDILQRKCLVDDTLLEGDKLKPKLIAFKSKSNFAPGHLKQPRRQSTQFLWEGWDTEGMRQYRKLISLYVHPVVNDNDMAATKAPRRKSSIQERHIEEAELRSVYVLFISMPKVRAKITGNFKEDSKLFKLLNDIMKVSTRELGRFSGHLRQFIVDDKGLVLIATFGLRGSSFPNMVTERALPATTVIHNALLSELDVYSRVGATLGNAYCGVVGGVKRHEYAVLGPSVNLAARLMASPKNPGILVDDAIRMKAGKAYGFNALEPVKAKGFANPVPIFEPLSSLERGWGKITPGFVGRKTEIKELLSMARRMVNFNSPAKFTFLSADSGTGKSATVIHAVEGIRKMINRRRRRVLVAKHVCKESDLLLPFSMLRSVLPDVLAENSAFQDEKSAMSTSRMSVTSGTSFGSVDGDWDGMSNVSAQSSNTKISGLSGVYASPERLLHVCREMEAPPEFIELVGHHLLGIDMETLTMLQGGKKTKGKPPSPQATVNFMAQAFQMCTKKASLVVIALDDVHQMDEMSWKVLQKLFITSRNLLIVCTSRPQTSQCKLSVDETFWNDLNHRYLEQKRFLPIKLPPLCKEDIRTMIATELKVEESEIADRFHDDVFSQSGGMPHFAIEILENVKRKKCIGKGDDGRVDWLSGDGGEFAFGSISDLILHRVDSFDATVRNVLNLGAVLGSSFDLLEIVAVLQHFIGASQTQKSLHARKISCALDTLVEEGILQQVFEGGEEEESEHLGDSDCDYNLEEQGQKLEAANRSYTFCHDVWRSSITQLMLDSRKRDMHKVIALTFESLHGEVRKDFQSRIKLFSHWKAGGDFAKTASLALSIGKSFEEQGLNNQSIRLYSETLDMLKGGEDSAETTAGYGPQVVESIGVTDLEYVVSIHIAMGKCLANLHKAAESVEAYQNGLKIYQEAPAGNEIEDRSIVFPIFSGLFVALKFGQIEQDKECTYEQNLVKKFVHETRLNGDPVHYTRALAMQGEMYGRLGNFEKAFEAHHELERVYNVDEHSAGICKAYGSDRSGQSYGASASWFVQQGKVEEALRTCQYVIDELMPKMEPRNVHNSAIMIYPTIWIMKDNGLALEARENFKRLVVDAFNEHYGEGAFTFCLPVYEPVLMLLDLAGKQDTNVENFDEYVEWALNDENLRFGKVINNSLGNFGRCSDSISAEICLLLAKRIQDPDQKIKIVKNGLAVARESVELTETKGMIVSYKQVKPVLDELESFARELGIE